MWKLPEKGTEGYIDKKKKGGLVASIFSFALVFVIYLTGIVLYHSNRTVYTVIAAVAVLPAAKALTGFLILAPYHSAKKEESTEIGKKVAETENGMILYDVVLAGKDKPMAGGLVVFLDGRLYLYSDSKKAEPAKTENYLKEILQNCNCGAIKMYTEYEAFRKQITGLAAKEKQDWDSLEENTKIRKKEMTRRIGQQILSYCI